jgi:hypothetical protein
MAKRKDTRDTRLSVLLHPPFNPKAERALEGFLFDHMLRRFGHAESLSEPCILQRLEHAHDVARRHFRPLNIWAAFRSEGLSDGEHDPGEFASYFDDRKARVKYHAEALLALLKDNEFPPAISHAIGATTKLYQRPSGHVAEHTVERSLPARLAELISAIPTPTDAGESLKKTRGKGEVRAEGIRAILGIWLEVEGSPPRFQRAGSAGTACGPFADFASGVLSAVGVKGVGIEKLVRDAVDMLEEHQQATPADI